MSFAAVINAVLDALKLSWPILLAVFLFCTLVVFMPDPWAARFKVSEPISVIQPICFFCGLLSFCLLVAHLTNQGWIKFKQHRKMKNLKKRLHHLSEDEKALLRQYLDNNTKSLRFNVTNGVVRGLEKWGVLYFASNINDDGEVVFPFNLQPWAWKYLKEKPQLLQEGE